MDKEKIAGEKKYHYFVFSSYWSIILPNFKQITRCTTKWLEKEKRKKKEIDKKSELLFFIYFTSILKL